MLTAFSGVNVLGIEERSNTDGEDRQRTQVLKHEEAKFVWVREH